MRGTKYFNRIYDLGDILLSGCCMQSLDCRWHAVAWLSLAVAKLSLAVERLLTAKMTVERLATVKVCTLVSKWELVRKREIAQERERGRERGRDRDRDREREIDEIRLQDNSTATVQSLTKRAWKLCRVDSRILELQRRKRLEDVEAVWNHESCEECVTDGS